MSERTPYVGFSNETLSKQPELKAGDSITCPKCEGQHVVEACGNKVVVLLMFRCRMASYIAAINGRSVIGVKADTSGEL